MIDLHTHSRCSDGDHTPEALVAEAAAAGIRVLALTDHDTINGIAAAKAAAATAGISFLSGIEISAQDQRELHILGYGVDETDVGLRTFYEENRQYRVQRRDRLLAMLNGKGIPITLEKIRSVNDGRSSGRPHFAKTLVEMGYASSISDAFDRYLNTPEFQTIERPKPSPEKAISMILSAGGVPVLAHPYTLQRTDADFRLLLQRLIACGLRGIECYYSKHTPEQTRYYLEIAKEYDLFFTCGSDYHGETIKPGTELGKGYHNSLAQQNIPEEEILRRLYAAMAS